MYSFYLFGSNIHTLTYYFILYKLCCHRAIKFFPVLHITDGWGSLCLKIESLSFAERLLLWVPHMPTEKQKKARGQRVRGRGGRPPGNCGSPHFKGIRQTRSIPSSWQVKSCLLTYLQPSGVLSLIHCIDLFFYICAYGCIAAAAIKLECLIWLIINAIKLKGKQRVSLTHRGGGRLEKGFRTLWPDICITAIKLMAQLV